MDVADFALWYLVFLFSTTLHEAAHAWAAHRGGDDTAYLGGQLSVDPLPHIKRSPVGMLLVPIISYVQVGWVMGWASVPFDPMWGKRNPRAQGMMSLAGPLANFALVLVSLVAIKVLLAAGVFSAPHHLDSVAKLVVTTDPIAAKGPLGALAAVLSVTLSLNLILGLFNLIPVAPLDGAGVLEGFFPDTLGGIYDKMREVPMMGLIGLLVAWNVFPYLWEPVFGLLLRVVYPDVVYV